MSTDYSLIARRLLVAGLFLSLSATCPLLLAQNWRARTSIRQVRVLGHRGTVEIEVESSNQIVPQTQVLSGPDRLVLDFPNAVPGSQLRGQPVNLGEVQNIRIGLFQSHPPITRVVLDLKAAQYYQVFASGRTVTIRLMNEVPMEKAAGVKDSAERASRSGLLKATYTPAAQMNDSMPAKSLEVSYRSGMLEIKANNASLADVLSAVQQRTGAEIAIPAGAEQERVVANLGPAPAQLVIAHLLNGSRFNFLIMNAANDPRQIDRVILTPRAEEANLPLTPPPGSDDAEEAVSAAPAPQPSQAQPQPLEPSQRPKPEISPQSDKDPQ